jgi:flagellar basal-body rod modification protein FlgD
MSVPINSLASVTGTQSSAATSNKAPASSAAGSTNLPGGLNESSFLQLLSAELKYQNPLKPMSNTTFIGELAQFSTLSATTSEETTLKSILSAVQGQNPLLAAAQLIGKTVTTATGQGQVTGVTTASSGVTLEVQGLGSVNVTAVTGVSG